MNEQTLANALPVTGETVASPKAADRLYQLAALTAGIFLLITLL